MRYTTQPIPLHSKLKNHAEKMLYVAEMIRNCYGTAPVSFEGIKLLANQASADLGIPKEEALEYVRQRVEDRCPGNATPELKGR